MRQVWRWIVILVLVLLAGCDAVGLTEPTPEVTILPYGALETLSISTPETVSVAEVVPSATIATSPTSTANAIIAPTQAPSVTPATSNTPGPAFVAQSTATPAISPTFTLTIPDCVPRADWPIYNVQQGDTLGIIAQRFGGTIEDIVAASCLANPDLIEIGQALRVPPSPASTNLDRPASIIFYAIATDGREGIDVGCGDTAVAVASGITPSGDTAADLLFALQALIDYRTATAAPGLSTALTIAGAPITTLAINDGLAVIEIDEPLTLVGVCGDARLEAQVLLTIFQFSDIERARISFGGVNLKQQLDLSGQTTADAVYTRDDVPVEQ